MFVLFLSMLHFVFNFSVHIQKGVACTFTLGESMCKTVDHILSLSC